MARAEFIKKARKPIYQRGLRVEYVSQKGKKEGQTLSKIDKTQPADESDQIFINAGESYYKWSFMYGGDHYSKEKPRASRLTQSEFLSQYYGFQESIEDFSPESAEDIENFVDNLKEEMESLRDECQDKLDNMPEQLQSAPSGEMLQERIDDLDNLVSELDGIDCDYEELEEGDEDEKDSHLTDWLNEKLEEIQGISFGL